MPKTIKAVSLSNPNIVYTNSYTYNMGYEPESHIETEYIFDTINDEFVEKILTDQMHTIDQYGQFTELLQEVDQYSHLPTYNLAKNVLSAAIFVRSIKTDLTINQDKNVKCNNEITELRTKITELEEALAQYLNPEEIANIGMEVNVDIAVSGQVPLLRLIAYLNVPLGWYYYFNGYNPTGIVDPDKYLNAEYHSKTFPTSQASYNALMSLIEDEGISTITHTHDHSHDNVDHH